MRILISSPLPRAFLHPEPLPHHIAVVGLSQCRTVPALMWRVTCRQWLDRIIPINLNEVEVLGESLRHADWKGCASKNL
jgi:hypothetical protein